MFAATPKTVLIPILVVGLFPIEATAITAEEAITLIRQAEQIIQIIRPTSEVPENPVPSELPTTSDTPPAARPTVQDRSDTNPKQIKFRYPKR
jgi:hypothetical protein